MMRFATRTLSLVGVVLSSVAFAGERTVTLAAHNMYCSACPLTVKASLQGRAGSSQGRRFLCR